MIHYFIRASSAMIVATSFGVLFGYAVNAMTLAAWVPNSTPMSIPTAFCFILLAVSQYLLTIKQRESSDCGHPTSSGTNAGRV